MISASAVPHRGVERTAETAPLSTRPYQHRQHWTAETPYQHKATQATLDGGDSALVDQTLPTQGNTGRRRQRPYRPDLTNTGNTGRRRQRPCRPDLTNTGNTGRRRQLAPLSTRPYQHKVTLEGGDSALVDQTLPTQATLTRPYQHRQHLPDLTNTG